MENTRLEKNLKKIKEWKIQEWKIQGQKII